MFFTLIVSLTAAAVDGFPQLTVLQLPQYQVQYLPVATLPKRSLNYHSPHLQVQKVAVYELNLGGFQSEHLHSAVPPVYTNAAENAGVIFEPIRSTLEKSQFFDQQRTTIPNARDGYADQQSNLRARYSYEKDEKTLISVPTKLHTRNNHKGEDVSINVVIEQRPDLPSTVPIIVPKRSFPSNDDARKADSVRYSNKNLNPTTHKITPQVYNLKSTRNFNSSSDRRYINKTDANTAEKKNSNTYNNINDADRLDSTSAKNVDATITTLTHGGPVRDVNTFNNKPGDRPTYVENSKQTPAAPDAPGEPSSSARGLTNVRNNDEEDRWIWNVTEKVETTTPDIENRVSFDGGSCPSGKVKVAGKCVDKDD